MNANELADKLEKHEFDAMEYGFDEPLLLAATMLRQQQEQINNLQQWEKRHLDVIEGLESIVNGNKEVMADWEAEVKSLKENNTLCWRNQRKQQAEIEFLKTELHKYKPQIWEVMKEANK